MKTLIITSLLFLGLSSQAGQKMVLTEAPTQPVTSPEKPIALSALCLYSSAYDPAEAHRYCMQDAQTVRWLSTAKVILSSSCVRPAPRTECHDLGGFILETTLTHY